jgi:hypothetical protein
VKRFFFEKKKQKTFNDYSLVLRGCHFVSLGQCGVGMVEGAALFHPTQKLLGGCAICAKLRQRGGGDFLA